MPTVFVRARIPPLDFAEEKGEQVGALKFCEHSPSLDSPFDGENLPAGQLTGLVQPGPWQ